MELCAERDAMCVWPLKEHMGVEELKHLIMSILTIWS